MKTAISTALLMAALTATTALPVASSAREFNFSFDPFQV